MKNIILSTSLLFLLLSVNQVLIAQTTYKGQLNLNNKENVFVLKTETDSLYVSVNKKALQFNAKKAYQLVKIKGNDYNLISNGDTLCINEVKKQILFSSGLTCFIKQKAAHQIILTDTMGKIILEAEYTSKGNVADYTISINDKKHEMELLSYGTNYLYVQSINEANYVPTYMYFVF